MVGKQLLMISSSVPSLFIEKISFTLPKLSLGGKGGKILQANGHLKNLATNDRFSIISPIVLPNTISFLSCFQSLSSKKTSFFHDFLSLDMTFNSSIL